MKKLSNALDTTKVRTSKGGLIRFVFFRLWHLTELVSERDARWQLTGQFYGDTLDCRTPARRWFRHGRPDAVLIVL
jgi:hypothetical protein